MPTTRPPRTIRTGRRVPQRRRDRREDPGERFQTRWQPEAGVAPRIRRASERALQPRRRPNTASGLPSPPPPPPPPPVSSSATAVTRQLHFRVRDTA